MQLHYHHTVFVGSNLKKAQLLNLNHIYLHWLLHSESNRSNEDKTNDDISCSSFRVQNLHILTPTLKTKAKPFSDTSDEDDADGDMRFPTHTNKKQSVQSGAFVEAQ
ncbi:hypothetical protein GQ600_6183 [Phytophthora cactorum]|nr:hypothetical protein GQ600_6183 [Phytophthora cactorum]